MAKNTSEKVRIKSMEERLTDLEFGQREMKVQMQEMEATMLQLLRISNSKLGKECIHSENLGTSLHLETMIKVSNIEIPNPPHICIIEGGYLRGTQIESLKVEENYLDVYQLFDEMPQNKFKDCNKVLSEVIHDEENLLGYQLFDKMLVREVGTVGSAQNLTCDLFDDNQKITLESGIRSIFESAQFETHDVVKKNKGECKENGTRSNEGTVSFDCTQGKCVAKYLFDPGGYTVDKWISFILVLYYSGSVPMVTNNLGLTFLKDIQFYSPVHDSETFGFNMIETTWKKVCCYIMVVDRGLVTLIVLENLTGKMLITFLKDIHGSRVKVLHYPVVRRSGPGNKSLIASEYKQCGFLFASSWASVEGIVSSSTIGNASTNENLLAFMFLEENLSNGSGKLLIHIVITSLLKSMCSVFIVSRIDQIYPKTQLDKLQIQKGFTNSCMHLCVSFLKCLNSGQCLVRSLVMGSLLQLSAADDKQSVTSGSSFSTDFDRSEVFDDSSMNLWDNNTNDLESQLEDYFKGVKARVKIYRGRVRDPLDLSKSNLQITESKVQGIIVSGVTYILITDSAELLRCFVTRMTNRAVGGTQMNMTSSRDHCIYILSIQWELKREKRFRKLIIVDLSGSERQEKTGAEGRVLEEAISFIEFHSKLCSQALHPMLTINKKPFCKDIQVFQLEMEHLIHEHHEGLLCRSLCVLPLRLIDCLLTWLVGSVSEEEACCYLHNMHMATLVSDNALVTLFPGWASNDHQKGTCLSSRAIVCCPAKEHKETKDNFGRCYCACANSSNKSPNFARACYEKTVQLGNLVSSIENSPCTISEIEFPPASVTNQSCCVPALGVNISCLVMSYLAMAKSLRSSSLWTTTWQALCFTLMFMLVAPKIRKSVYRCPIQLFL